MAREAQGCHLASEPPLPEERARAAGRGAYLVGLVHSPRQLYDLVGDHFGPSALLRRVVVPPRAWLLGDVERGYGWHGPATGSWLWRVGRVGRPALTMGLVPFFRS